MTTTEEDLKKAIQSICKSWAIFKQYRRDDDEDALDDAIIQAERLARK